MAVLRVARAGRHLDGYVDTLIEKMFLDERKFFIRGYGIVDSTPAMVANSLNSVRQTWRKNNKIKVHYMELHIEYEAGKEIVLMVADIMGRFFYTQGFQSLITAIDGGNEYMIVIAVNATAFLGDYSFHDNNSTYQQILEFLRVHTLLTWRVAVSQNTLFDPAIRDGNYIHGIYV